MKIIFKKGLFIIALIASLTFTGVAQMATNTVSGIIFDSQRQPVSEVQVELLNEFNSVLQRMKTDGSGKFFFRRVPDGRFYIRVLTLGTSYEEQVQEIETTNVGALGRRISDNIQKDIILRSKKNTNSNQVNDVLFFQEVPDDAKKFYEQGVSELAEKKVIEGILNIENSIRLFPTYFNALQTLGIEYIKEKKYEEAKNILIKAVDVNPRCFSCLYGLSFSSYSLNQFENTIEYAQKTLTINRSSVATLLILGLSYRAIKDFKNAESVLIEAKKLDKKNPDIHWNLALLYAHNLNQYDDAASELELYLKTTPDNKVNEENIKKLIKQFREKAKKKN